MRSRKIMVVTLYILAAIAVALIGGRVIFSMQFHKEVKQLFDQSKSVSDKKFSNKQLLGLPAPVQRYFRHILKEGQPYISYAGITHDGQFKTGFDKPWIDIKGDQYATTEKPGFIWKGTTTFFTARDMYIADKGRLVVSLLSIINIVDGKGAQYDQGELLRWLGESVLYPTNLLPCERLQWTPIDAQSAKLTFNYNQLALFFIVSFNNAGEIIKLETKRYMDEKNLEAWVIELAGYKELNGIFVPTFFEVKWKLKKEDFSYAKFNLKKVTYNNPAIF